MNLKEFKMNSNEFKMNSCDFFSNSFDFFNLVIHFISFPFSPDQRLLAVSLLDSTVKVFFSDTLKVSCPSI